MYGNSNESVPTNDTKEVSLTSTENENRMFINHFNDLKRKMMGSLREGKAQNGTPRESKDVRVLSCDS